MSDQLGEALERFPSDELPDDPTTADHDAYEVVATTARNWLALESLGFEGNAKTEEAWRGWMVQGSEPELGRYLIIPLNAVAVTADHEMLGESSGFGDTDSNRATDSTERERHGSPNPVTADEEAR